MCYPINQVFGVKTALAFFLALFVSMSCGLAQTPTISMENNFSEGERVTFGYSNAPPEQGLIVIVPEDVPDNNTNKADLGAKYYGRLHYAPKRRGVLETDKKESWDPVKPGEYELRMYDGSNRLIARHAFTVGSSTPAAGTIDAATGDQPSDDQPPAPPPSANEASAGAAIKTIKKTYDRKQKITVEFSNAPAEGAFVLLVPQDTPIDDIKPPNPVLYMRVQHRVVNSKNTMGIFKRAGKYEARLYDLSGELLARYPFRVR